MTTWVLKCSNSRASGRRGNIILNRKVARVSGNGRGVESLEKGCVPHEGYSQKRRVVYPPEGYSQKSRVVYHEGYSQKRRVVYPMRGTVRREGLGTRCIH